MAPPPILPPPVADPEPSGAREMDDEDLVEELLATVNSARAFADFRRTQRKECLNLLRWLQLVLPLLEELRDSAPRLTDDAFRRLALLGRAFTAARRLLRSCHDGSKIFLALESEVVLGKFSNVYEKMNSALDGMPYSELAISDEVLEQVELMNAQLMRCKTRTDTQDIELSMDLMVILENKEDKRNADRAILERLAKKLELQTLAELRAETIAIKKLINERNGQHADSTKQIVDLLNKFKEIAGIEEKNVLGAEVTVPKSLGKCPSLMIPNDFLCPITLEIMTDPVIVASGQTYERRSIQKWLDSGERSCPKTREPLAHLSLAPNYALKNLILQWCDKNKVELQKREPEPAAEQLGEQRKESIPSLVEALSSIHPDVQRKAAKKIRALSKESPENRRLIADGGGIPALIGLLAFPDRKVQENTVTSLLNLSIDESNKQLITRGGAIPLIIEILRSGSAEAQENSAAALFSLSMIDENKAAIGRLGGIAPLVELLRSGSERGKKDAATAIFNLVLNPQNKARAAQAGVVAALRGVIDDGALGMVDEALSICLLLSSHAGCCAEIGTAAFVEKLVQLIKEGTPKNKECALAVLLELGSKNKPLLVQALRFGLHEHLSQIAKNGTSRAQRKATSLIQLARKCY